MAKFHWRFFLHRWHRRIGLVAALFVLLLVTTGILLNHTNDIGLDRMPLENAWLRAHYGLDKGGVDAGKPASYRFAGRELQARDGQLRLAGIRLTDCPQLIGVMETQDQVLVVCPDRLVLLTPDGELIDQADSLRGIPSGLSAVAVQGNNVFLRQGETSLGVNLNDLSVHPVEAAPDVAWQGAQETIDATPMDAITWERVVLDLHSGRLFGHFGVWLVDLMAIGAALLALSGLVLARRRHRAR